MEIKKITVNGEEYEFVNNSRGNRSGFVHETTLFRGGGKVNSCKVQYYNRTWERYTYQTVMMRCVSDEIEWRYENYINNYKLRHNIKRLTAEKRAVADEEFNERDDIKALREVKEQLK